MANRLAGATSPYLLQHAGNPVDWWEWGPEAFEQARARDVPILLSVGYAACHWCHVMAHESFEDESVARALNANFVAIKVDREERPDVDSIYMTATQATTGAGGWPMTCLLTHTGEPFWCGTYLPKAQFLDLLRAADATWRERRTDVEESGARLGEALRQANTEPVGQAQLDAAALHGVVDALFNTYDRTHGGFGGAPKFPPSMVLSFLAKYAARTGSETARRMLEHTCEALARSGMYDQVGGGFARYAVDRAWTIPHFEKMLYDNALLLRVFAHLAARSEGTLRRLATDVVVDTVTFLQRDLGTTGGAFASSLDADTQGVEGATYVWTPAQMRSVLGPEDAERAAAALRITDAGTFEGGTSTIQLASDIDHGWWRDVRRRLFAARAARPQPDRDDKVVTAWNGLAIAALADAGTLLEEPGWVAAARRCATTVLDVHLVEGRLRRSSRNGQVGAADGVAEDYGDLAEGLLALYAATGEPEWLSASGDLLATAREIFRGRDGLMHDTAADTELFMRPRTQSDNAEPCGASALGAALIRYGALAGDHTAIENGRAALASMAQTAMTAPRFAGWALSAAEDLLAGPLVVAIPDAPGAQELARTARRAATPGTPVVLAATDSAPLFAGRGPVAGRAAAYICRATTCEAPITDPSALAARLRR